MSVKLNDILNKFNIESEISEYGNGHINRTYITSTKRYIVQKVNTDIFKDPHSLMENIYNVTAFLRDKIAAEGGDPDRETMTVVKTMDGKNYYDVDKDNVFRVYKFIENTKTIESSKSFDELYAAGVGFGHFQKLLSDYPADTLHETIKDFHNTPKRVETLREAIEKNIAGRADDVKDEIEFALEYAKIAPVVTDEMEKGTVPVRVTHNDTKINNILFDTETDKAICVIDLDTVMPGSALFDYGDALRFCASSAAEDERDLSKVYFDLELFEAFTGGYLSELAPVLTPKEAELLAFSAQLLTYECGIRFLTDHLNGDTYFRIHREGHNLDRARTQFKLVSDMDKKMEQMNGIIAKYL